MAVVSSIHMVVVTHAGALVTLGTVLLCYTIAVSLGHVPAWLPMISDCAVDPPEKYIFRLGIVTGAMILALNTVVVYQADRSFSNSKLSLILGVVACTCLAIVGVVNEKENNDLHSASAVIFFICYDLYMIVMTFFVYQEPSSYLMSRMVKTACAAIGVACMGLLVAIVMNYLPMDIYLAVFEWCDTFTIAIFVWSFALDDLTGLDLCIVREAKEIEKIKNVT